MTIEQLLIFFGWMSLIHVIILLLFLFLLLSCRSLLVRWHSRLLSISEDRLPLLYVRAYVAYKLLAMVTAFVPYLALLIMV